MSQALDIRKLLKSVVAYKASDLHLVSRSEPQIRIDGRLVALNLPTLDGKMIEDMAYALLTEKQKKDFEEHNELDFAIMLQREKGLILVTGPTGSGKSTTLAAMLNEINETENRHIITVEDPVEFVHQNKKCLFSQRNIGNDTKSFALALKYAMRQDPDVILIGEMRDQETIGAALTAAETGHLVFGTLHTNSAPQTINRIIDVFSGEEQPQVRAQLSTSLVAVIAQALLPKIGGGRIATQEFMLTNPAIANLIREDKVHQVYSQMQLNQQETGMVTQTQQLSEFVKKRLVSRDTAISYANRPEELIRVLDAGGL
jgi:twitching motility protein PilT